MVCNIEEDGKNAIRLAIDNEHEDFLYDGSTLVAPSGGATAPLHLYDGPTDKTSSVSEWRINDTNNDAEANWKTSVNTNAEASINTSTGVLTISGLKSASAKIRVRAKYNSKPYYAEFTGNKTNQDKYDIVLTPNSIAYNSANYQTQRIQVSASGIGIGGTKLSPSISWNQNSGNLRVFWSTVSINNNGSTVIGTPTRLTSSYKDVTGNECSDNVGIYFELRWYNNSSAQDSSTDYRVCDYETVEIAKVTNGPKGKDATMYNLDPNPNNVNFRSNATGDFLGSQTVTCKIKKTVGDTTTEISNGTDGLYLYYRKVGQPSDAYAYPNNGVSVSASEAIDENYPVTAIRFTLSTATAVSGVNANNTVKEITVPILCDGRRGTNGINGTNGTNGKMFFSMGIYTYGKSYVRTTDFIPMVYYDNGVWNDALGTTGNYYYLAEGKTGTNVTPGTNDSIWVPAGSYGLVIAQGVFAEFAKLGSFIISGDFFISQCGTIIAGGSSQAVNEGSASIKRYYYNGVKSGYGFPSYMYFDANDPMAEDVVGNTNTYTIAGNGVMDCAIVKRIYFYAAQATTLKITVTPSSEAGYDFGAVGLLDKKTLSEDGVDAMTISDGDTPTLVKASGTASDWTTINISQGAHFLEIGYFKDSSNDANQDKATFKFEEVSNSYIGGYSEMKFRPTKVINARTGAEYMASGNFVVNANGVVTMAGNKVIVDQNGNVVMNNIEVNNANINGSLMFHNIVKSTPNYGYAQLYEAAYEVISGVTYECAPVRLKGDIFLLTGAASTLTQSAFTIYLPPASLFVGTSIRIILGTYKTTSSKWEREFCNMKLEVNHPNGCEQRAEDYELIAMNHFAVAMPFTFSNGNAGFGYFERIEYNSYGSIELIATDNPFNSNYKVWMIVDAKE